ncbi:MAG: arsenate reductase ArsC [Caldisericia bacterium]
MKKRVLFLCVANSARSQMAEGLLKFLDKEDRFEVFSAGSKPSKLNPYAIKVLDEIGIDISSHHSKHWKELDSEEGFDFVISVCSDSEAECPVFTGEVGQRLRWVFDDPADCIDKKNCTEKFRIIRDRIKARVINWLETGS